MSSGWAPRSIAWQRAYVAARTWWHEADGRVDWSALAAETVFEGEQLGHWVAAQRGAFADLGQEQEGLLVAIGVEEDPALAQAAAATETLPVGIRAGTIAAEQEGRVPLWGRRYVRFPRLLFALTGTGRVGFDNRVDELQLHARDRHVAKMPRAVPAAAASLEGLQQYGPSGEVRYPLVDRRAEPAGFDELTCPAPADRGPCAP
ncbi:hypothetical protein Kpho02_36970 [Kitasatospora phosalacinea]|uniref:Helicase-associated domain-containing protein n=1 Tax=Kitasatospora phosalacinea TaxID=2065 RepID=A0A9W6QAC7_9ACTN|nr:helicase associated domain-containing protein [Kitasatospora phosalacinea]GLW71398.1 hypothetical protein Kpho02_36970 [Kitasatospora phosalacinea]